MQIREIGLDARGRRRSALSSAHSSRECTLFLTSSSKPGPMPMFNAVTKEKHLEGFFSRTRRSNAGSALPQLHKIIGSTSLFEKLDLLPQSLTNTAAIVPLFAGHQRWFPLLNTRTPRAHVPGGRHSIH